MFNDLLTYKELWEACPESFGFGDVEILRDFGPFKKGDKVHNLWFNLEDGTVTEYAEDGATPIKNFRFQLVAVSEEPNA